MSIVNTSIKNSPLWHLFKVWPLTTTICNVDNPEFASWIDNISDGAGPEVNMNFINNVSTVENLVDFVYPPHILSDPSSWLKQAILCPTNAQVNRYNNTIVSRIDGIQQSYLAVDSLQEAEEVGLMPPQNILDYIAAHTPPGLP